MANPKNNDCSYDDHLNRKPVSPRKFNWVRTLIFYSAIVYLAVLVIHIGFSHPQTTQTVPSGQVIAPSVQVTAPSGEPFTQSVQPEQWGTPLRTGIIIPAYSDDGNQTIDKEFNWQYDDKSYSWSVSVPAGLLTYDRQIYSFINTYFQSNGDVQAAANRSPSMTQNMMSMITACSIKENDSYTAWIDEPHNSAWIANVSQGLADSAHSAGYDYYQEADYILSFVGSAIPYNATTIAELPAQTMIDSGDCKDKSILYASLLKSLGYGAVLLQYPDVIGNTGHMAVGVALNDSQLPPSRSLYYYLYNGTKYYYAETTAPNWTVGNDEGSIVQNRSAEVYLVN